MHKIATFFESEENLDRFLKWNIGLMAVAALMMLSAFLMAFLAQ